MNQSNRDDLIIGAAILAVFCVIVGVVAGIGLAVESWQCNSRWADSDMHSRWEFGGGCKVQRKDGTWVPERLLRELSTGA